MEINCTSSFPAFFFSPTCKEGDGRDGAAVDFAKAKAEGERNANSHFVSLLMDPIPSIHDSVP